MLFAAGDAVTIERLSAALEVAPAELLDAAAALENRYDFENRGIMLLRIEDKLQLASRPMYGPYAVSYTHLQRGRNSRKEPRQRGRNSRKEPRQRGRNSRKEPRQRGRNSRKEPLL